MLTITIKIVTFSPEVHVLMKLRDPEDAVVCKFVVYKVDEELIVYLGYTSQHRSLALFHVYEGDEGKVADFYKKEPREKYPKELLVKNCVGAGSAQRVPFREEHRNEPDRIMSWYSSTLDIETSEELQRVLGREIIRGVGRANDDHLERNPKH